MGHRSKVDVNEEGAASGEVEGAVFRVRYREFEFPCGKRSRRRMKLHPGTFAKRQKARNWCRRRSYLVSLVIIHPDGTEEPFSPAARTLP